MKPTHYAFLATLIPLVLSGLLLGKEPAKAPAKKVACVCGCDCSNMDSCGCDARCDPTGGCGCSAKQAKATTCYCSGPVDCKCDPAACACPQCLTWCRGDDGVLYLWRWDKVVGAWVEFGGEPTYYPAVPGTWGAACAPPKQPPAPVVVQGFFRS